MKTFTIGAKVFCDFPFGGKPKGVVTDIVTPGNGKDKQGEVKVKLSKTLGVYRKGETLTVSTFLAVPLAMKLPRRKGQFFTRISTQYSYTK